MPTIGKEFKKEAISLYFHIPFCTKKCDYCHFYVLPNKAEYHSLLIEGLLLEINLWGPQLANKELVSIYFGGGTPSLIGPEAITRLLKALQQYISFHIDDIEITLEANPETLTTELMRDYAAVGVNRVSIGIQSLDDKLLQRLGRTHHAKTAIDAVNATNQAGIENISIDLMYDIPCQTLEAWQHTLEQAVQLPAMHLSLYNLTIEPNTLFFKYREKIRKELPDADSSTQMYLMAVETLEKTGLKQYEISAFARDNKYSRHNVGYWTARPFLGFGPSAFSYWQNKRFRNVAHLQRYVQDLKDNQQPIDFSEELPPTKRTKELLAIAMRLCSGVDCKKFESKHGPLEKVTHEVLEQLHRDGFLKKTEKKSQCPEIGSDFNYSLTAHGRLFYDTIAAEII